MRGVAAILVAGCIALLVVAAVPPRTAGHAAPGAPAAAGGGFAATRVTVPAYRIGAARPLGAATATWAPVRRAALVRLRPGGGAPVRARLGTRTSDGTTAIVQVVGRARRAGRLWVRVRYPGPANAGSGWVVRAALGGYTAVDTRLVVDRVHLRLTLYRAGRAVLRAPVGIGRAATPTPAGRFFVVDRLTRFRDPAYGPVAFGTSARSPVLADWPGGGVVGIHGTDRPGLIPGRISHGCVRLRNADALRLARLLPIGTPVVIR